MVLTKDQGNWSDFSVSRSSSAATTARSAPSASRTSRSLPKSLRSPCSSTAAFLQGFRGPAAHEAPPRPHRPTEPHKHRRSQQAHQHDSHDFRWTKPSFDRRRSPCRFGAGDLAADLRIFLAVIAVGLQLLVSCRCCGDAALNAYHSWRFATLLIYSDLRPRLSPPAAPAPTPLHRGDDLNRTFAM